MSKCTLVGFKKFKSKKGVDTCLAKVASPFSPADISKGACGSDVQDVWLYDDLYDVLQPEDVGKEVKIDYNIFNGRAFIANITVIGK